MKENIQLGLMLNSRMERPNDTKYKELPMKPVSMEILSAEYKVSLAALQDRIDQLQAAKQQTETNSGMEQELKDRLKVLTEMQVDLKDLTREVRHYYDRGWWRSEKFTLNARKARKFVYCEPIYD